MKNKAEEKVSCNEEAVQAVDPRVAGRVVLVHTADGPVVREVISLSDVDLYDSLTTDQSFIHSAIVIINEICLTSESDEYIFTPFATLLSECERRLDYIEAATFELWRRLEERGKEKTA